MLLSVFFPDEDRTPVQIDIPQVTRFYLPLALRLLFRTEALPRLMVGIAGPPGSGKTAFSAILSALINSLSREKRGLLVGLDGWHYPNEYLATHTLARDGQTTPLSSLKGSPESFDAEAAFTCLRAIRLGQEVRFPIYSRKLHAPLAEAGAVLATHKIILVEGNYLLLDEEPWSKFRQLFDVRIFLQIDPTVLETGLAERHQRGGKPPEAVERQIQQVDLPNARRVLRGSSGAQIVVHKTDARHIQRIEYAR